MSKSPNSTQPPNSFDELKLLIRSEIHQIEQGQHVDT